MLNSIYGIKVKTQSMCQYFINVLFRITLLVVMLPVSFSVYGAVFNIEDETIGNHELTDGFFNIEVTESKQKVIVIANAEQAKKMTNVLLKRFQQIGDISTVKFFAPNIIQYSPKDPSIRYLYSIVFAVEGRAEAAEGQILLVKPNKESQLLYLLAKASIANAKQDYTVAKDLFKQAIKQDIKHPFAYNQLGLIAIAQKQNSLAEEYFKMAIQYAPESSMAYSNLGGIEYLQAKYNKAFQSFSDSLLLVPGHCPALIGRASVMLQSGNKIGAINDLEACLNSNPRHLLAIKRLVPVYLDTGKFNKAESLANTSIDSMPTFSILTLADIYLRRNDAVEARKLLNQLDSKTAQAYYLLSFCDMLENKLESAIEQLKQAENLQPESSLLKLTTFIYSFYGQRPVDIRGLEALIKNPNFGPLAAFVMGNVYASQNKFDKAHEFWSKSRDLHPGFIFNGLSLEQIKNASFNKEQVYLSLGELYHLKGYYNAAISQFEKAIEINEKSFLANFLISLALSKKGEGAHKVAPYLLSSIDMADTFFPSNYMLAEYYLKQKDIDKAINYYRKAASSEPDQGVLIKLGLLYEGRGKMQDAASIYQIFIDNYPQNFLGYNQLAWLYAKQGIELNKALELGLKANNIWPDNASVNDTIGWVYYHKKDYALAEQYLNIANEISKMNSSDILFHLASVKYKTGDLKTAQKFLLKAISISDSFESKKSAKKLLEKIDASL